VVAHGHIGADDPEDDGSRRLRQQRGQQGLDQLSTGAVVHTPAVWHQPTGWSWHGLAAQAQGGELVRIGHGLCAFHVRRLLSVMARMPRRTWKPASSRHCRVYTIISRWWRWTGLNDPCDEECSTGLRHRV